MPHDPRLSLTLNSVAVYMKAAGGNRYPALLGMTAPRLSEIPMGCFAECVDGMWFMFFPLRTARAVDTLLKPSDHRNGAHRKE